MALEIIPIPCLRDNYAYLIVDAQSAAAAVVDPSEATPVLNAIKEHKANVQALWLTHHHWDHVGGVEDLCRALPNLEVWGSHYDREHQRIPQQSRALRDHETFTFAGVQGSVLEIPGHTLGAIAYLIAGNLFSGDTLFLAGCGRVFEGTMQMMAQSLIKLRELDSATQIWCGHEYSENNLRFALSLEPKNPMIHEAIARVSKVRAAQQASVPGTIAEEREINPFFRFDRADIMAGRSAVDTFGALRKAKDAF